MSGLGPLHFTGKVDRQEEMLILNQQKEQAVLKTLLEKRDPKPRGIHSDIGLIAPPLAAPPLAKECVPVGVAFTRTLA